MKNKKEITALAPVVDQPSAEVVGNDTTATTPSVVAKFAISDDQIKQYEAEFMALTITDETDIVGYELVESKIGLMVSVRNKIDKARKEKNEDALAEQRRNNAEAKKLIEKVQAIEDKLNKEKKRIDNIKDAIALAAQQKLEGRIIEMRDLGMIYDLVDDSYYTPGELEPGQTRMFISIDQAKVYDDNAFDEMIALATVKVNEYNEKQKQFKAWQASQAAKQAEDDLLILRTDRINQMAALGIKWVDGKNGGFDGHYELTGTNLAPIFPEVVDKHTDEEFAAMLERCKVIIEESKYVVAVDEFAKEGAEPGTTTVINVEHKTDGTPVAVYTSRPAGVHVVGNSQFRDMSASVAENPLTPEECFSPPAATPDPVAAEGEAPQSDAAGGLNFLRSVRSRQPETSELKTDVMARDMSEFAKGGKPSTDPLEDEDRASLQAFLETIQELAVPPMRSFSGGLTEDILTMKFNDFKQFVADQLRSI